MTADDESLALLSAADVDVDWGILARVPFQGRRVELMRFDESGSFHAHDEWEIAVCLAGVGFVEIDDGSRETAGPGRIFVIPPGREHRMVPDDPTDGEYGAYLWVVLYSENRPIFVDPTVGR